MPFPGVGAVGTPREAIEIVLRRALERSPCLISFSGGRDSSAMLASAVHLARREGFDLPVPATAQFPAAGGTHEDEWQQVVLRHLGIDEWFRIPITTELDALGPIARPALLEHGLLWPCNSHFHVPIFDAARGGSVVTGLGGDEIGACSASARPERVVGRVLRPTPRDVLGIGLALAPGALRRWVYARRAELPRWLTPHGAVVVRAAMAEDDARVPFGFDRKLIEWVWPARYFRTCVASLDILGSARDVEVVNPFIEPEVLGALAGAGGRIGFGPREELVRALFGDLLPEATVSRGSKGSFDQPLWGPEARAFAEAWDGSGLDGGLIRIDAVRDEWLAERPAFLSTLLLQQAWLHAQGGASSAT